jgi:signal transduction histidine kinase
VNPPELSPQVIPYRVKRAIWIAVGLLLVVQILIRLLALPRHLEISEVIFSLFCLLAAGLFYRRSVAPSIARWAFLLLALSLGMRGVESLLEVGLRFIHLPMGDVTRQVVRLAFVVPTGMAILLWPTEDQRPGRHWREWLDALLFATTLFFVVWMMGLTIVFRNSALTGITRWLSLAFLLAYDILLGLALYRGLRTPAAYLRVLGWMGLGIFIALLGNLTWMSLVLAGRYVKGGPSDLLVMLIPVAFIVAALTPFGVEARRASRLPLVLPYLPFLAAVPLGVRFLARGVPSQDPTGLILIFASVGLLGLRQAIAILDLNRLSLSLECQVAERTRALEESQSIILANQRMNFMATLGAGIAHDVNNLLNVVALITSKLETERQQGLPLEASDLEAMQGVSSQASGLLRKLLSLGRQHEPHAERFRLGQHIRSMQLVLRRLVPSVNLEMEIEDEPLAILADPIHVEQVLVNLVSNARDAMPEGGVIRFCCKQEAEWVLLEISDTGTGISRDNLARIFEPFFTTKAPSRGTGLGLASVKALVEECRGSLEVRSVLGQGTTFSVRFPSAE